MTNFFSDISQPELIDNLNSDGVGVLPTDTVYGLVARAHSQSAIAKLYGIKSRERKPGTTIAASVEQLIELGFPASELEIASRYWPNAVSVELSSANIPDYLKAGQSVMAARIPNHPALRTLLERTGPLMTTSANDHKQPTSTTVEMAHQYFGNEVDFYVDGGDLSNRAPSTIIGISPDGTITMYREGAVRIEPSA